MSAPRFPEAPPFARRLTSVGVTGTNGKTTTVTFLAAVLERHGGPVARTSTLGSALGGQLQEDLPRTHSGFVKLMRRCLERGGRFGAIEVTSEVLALGFAQAWPFTVGVFTNLSHDHLDAHKTPEHYFASKAQLFLHLAPGGVAVLNGCDESTALLEEVVPDGVQVVRYGVPGSRGDAVGKLAFEARDCQLTWQGSRATVSDDAGSFELRSAAIGEIFVENALAALAAARAVGVERDVALAALAEAEAPRGRFEVVHRSPHVVIDYAHSPDALARTLATARELCDGTLTVVFGAGGNRDVAKRPEMGKAASLADRIILTTDNPRSEDPADIARGIESGVEGTPTEIVLDRRAAVGRALADAGAADCVVVAGKGHETELVWASASSASSDHELVRSALAAAEFAGASLQPKLGL